MTALIVWLCSIWDWPRLFSWALTWVPTGVEGSP